MTAEPMSDGPRAKPRTQQPGRRRSEVIDGQRNSTAWRALRDRWQARLPQPCPRCPEVIQPWQPWDLDHVGDPVALGGRTGADLLRPAHRSCNRSAGQEVRKAIRRAGIAALQGKETAGFLDAAIAAPATRPPALSPERDEPETPPIDSPVWDACPWLSELRQLPPEATWPRLMSPPHPEAVGSYGAEAIEWISDVFGQELRWFQKLAITRLLEHDKDGRLVWLFAVVSTARQVGKSVLLTALSAWRLNSGELFGEKQRVMHTGKDLQVCRAVHMPGRQWAKEQPGYRVRESNGSEEIVSPDGSEWIVRAQSSVYGYGTTLGLVDEAWAILPSRVEEGLEPTIAERASGQVLLFSTAHRKATALVPLQRATAFASWHEPASSLLLEWSAPADAALDDMAAWRMASPHWSDSRERLLKAKHARIALGQSEDADEDDAAEAFRSQFLNVWPGRTLLPHGAAEPLTDRATWDGLRDDFAAVPVHEPVTVAIEDWYGMGAAAAACGALPDGRLLTWGGVFVSRAEAYSWAGFVIGGREGSTLLVGATLGAAEPAEYVPEAADVATCTTTTTRAALPLVRSLVRSGRLAHSGDADMGGQVVSVRLLASSTGGLILAHGDSVRADLLKAMSWAVADRAAPLTAAPDWFVF